MSRRMKSSSSAGEFSRRSVPSSSKLSKTPSMQRSRISNIPTSSVRASASKRTSHIGTAEYHMKDMRPINDKSYMRKSVMEIVSFVTDKGLPFNLTPKMFMPPSNRDYYRVCEFVYQMMCPGYSMNSANRPEDEITKLFRDLCYPYNLSKSTWSNVGIMSAWPHALGALDWLVDLVKYKISFEENELKSLIGDDDTIKQLKYDYYKETYIEFMNGRDEPFTEINEDYESKIADINREKLEDIEELKKFDANLQIELEQLDKERAESDLIHEEHARQLKNKSSMEEYFASFDVYCQQLQEKISGCDERIQTQDDIIDELNREILNLKGQEAKQDLSQEDIQRMRIENQQMISSIESLETHCKKLEEEQWEKEIERTKIVEKINVQVVECNNLCRELNLVKGDMQESDYTLEQGHMGISENMSKINMYIMPALMEEANKGLESIGKLQQQRNHLSTACDQLQEQIDDNTESHEVLKRELETLNKEYSILQADISTQEEALKLEIDEEKVLLERNKRINEVSVEDMNAEMSTQTKRLEQAKQANDEWRLKWIEYLKELMHRSVLQRERCDELLMKFAQHMNDNARKRKELLGNMQN